MAERVEPVTAAQWMESLDRAAEGVAALTGMKAQLVDQGWSEPNAERLVIAIINTTGSGK